MTGPSGRLLRLLSLLQTHRFWAGGELAERLEVSPRTVRRDVERLRELGYEVAAVRGVAGGYQLRAGRALPPLLLEDEEAVAIAVGLRSSAAGAVGGGEEAIGESSLRALTKLVGLMPPALRRRMDAVQSQTVPAPRTGPRVDPATLTTLAQGCRDDEAVRFEHTGRDGEPATRHVEPHRLVSLGQRWYLVAYDRDRHDWRSFRVDRIREVRPTGARYRPRTLPATDALAFVRAGFAAIPRRYDVRVRVAAPAGDVAAGIGGGWTVTGTEEGCLIALSTDWLDWPVATLATLDAEVRVESPRELVELLARAGERLTRAAGRSGEASSAASVVAAAGDTVGGCPPA